LSSSLLFIHGFLGDSEKSEKFHFIQNYCQSRGLEVIPFELKYDATDFARLLKIEAVGAIGVSLGGLFARYKSFINNIPCLSINTRFDLTNFVNAGTYKKYNTDESVVISNDFLDQLAEINLMVNQKKANYHTVVLSKVDEQVDYQENLQSYLTIIPTENIKSVANENHRITLLAFEAVFTVWYNDYITRLNIS